MDIIGYKSLAGAILLFLAIFFGWLPPWCFWKLKKNYSVEKISTSRSPWIQYVHSLAAGVLMATCLLNLLPETVESVRLALSSERSSTCGTNRTTDNLTGCADGVENKEEASDYPVAECLVALGFLSIYFIDSLTPAIQEAWAGTGNQEGAVNHLNQPAGDARFFRLAQQDDSEDEESHTLTRCSEDSTDVRLPRQLQTTSLDERSDQSIHPLSSETALAYSNSAFYEKAITKDNGTGANELDLHLNTESDTYALLSLDESDSDTKRNGSTVKLRSLTLLTALCVHGFFDGVMLGLQTSESAIVSLTLALALHKSFVTLGFALTLISIGNDGIRILLYITIFASVSPLGLLLSAAFVYTNFEVSDNQFDSLVPGCLQSFAVGTFMYVTFTEITARHHCRSWRSLMVGHAFLLAGFAVMAGLRAAVGGA